MWTVLSLNFFCIRWSSFLGKQYVLCPLYIIYILSISNTLYSIQNHHILLIWTYPRRHWVPGIMLIARAADFLFWELADKDRPQVGVCFYTTISISIMCCSIWVSSIYHTHTQTFMESTALGMKSWTNTHTLNPACANYSVNTCQQHSTTLPARHWITALILFTCHHNINNRIC